MRRERKNSMLFEKHSCEDSVSGSHLSRETTLNLTDEFEEVLSLSLSAAGLHWAVK